MKQLNYRDTVIGQKPALPKFVICGFALAFLSISAPAGVHAQTPQQPATEAAAEKTADTPAGVSAETVTALQNRIKSLEAQVVDLRAMIGTFASMGQRPAGSGNRLQNQGPDQGMRQGREQGSQDSPRQQGSRNLPWQSEGGERSNSLRPQSSPGEGPNPRAALPVPDKRPDVREDGVSSGRIASNGEAGNTDPAELSGEIKPAKAPESTDAEALYKDAYSHMLRRDYASAQSAFGSLLKNHPQSRMAGNAQYWLGETYYVRGKYRPAADAFLKAYRNYSNGIKAPDSLMKLALSLTRLGQKGAACKTFDELDTKYPDAPSHVKQRAGMERRRAGCN